MDDKTMVTHEQEKDEPVISVEHETNEQEIAVDDVPLTADSTEAPTKVKFKFTTKKIVVLSIIVVAVIVIAFAFFHKSKFEKVSDECLQIAGTLSRDEDYFTIDTYPAFLESLESTSAGAAAILAPEYQANALEAIQYANEELGFNSFVYSKMLETTALMGRQSEENDKYKVSWTYHPDDGLEVTYEKK